jgi:hypothetical protein
MVTNALGLVILDVVESTDNGRFSQPLTKNLQKGIREV